MNCTQNITNDIVWVGSGERRLALFENLFPLENGVTYNSYVILDEKTALLDTVDSSVSGQFFDNLQATLQGRELDYMVINHMEPDHCANIDEICRRWPGVKIVGNTKTFQFIKQFYAELSLEGRTHEVKEGDTLSLGRHTLRFLMAPMVHWPEVMLTYETTQDILFSADAFGTFGGYTGNIFSDEMNYKEQCLSEARRYYTNIVGKYGAQVLAVLKKLDGITPKIICPLHGPILRGDDIGMMVEKYLRWASYRPEKAGVVLAYASIYGNTEAAVHCLAAMLSQNGVKDICMFDVSKTHHSTIIAEVFKHSHVVFASPTYNMRLFDSMDVLMQNMAALNVQNREVAIIANGTWAIAAHKIMQEILGGMKNMQLLEEPLLIQSTMKPSQQADMQQIAKTLADAIHQQAPLLV